jgi:2-dehydropantoate 2-reductase
MDPKETIYILGSGAIGFPLAAYLANAGRTAVAVRTSRKDVAKGTITVTVHDGANHISAPVETISLSRLASLDGTIVITTKAFANKTIALELEDKEATGPVVI